MSSPVCKETRCSWKWVEWRAGAPHLILPWGKEVSNNIFQVRSSTLPDDQQDGDSQQYQGDDPVEEKLIDPDMKEGAGQVSQNQAGQ